jgi:hypothetical protein
LSEHLIITKPKLAFGLNLCFFTTFFNPCHKLEARVATLSKKQKILMKTMKTQGTKKKNKKLD